MASGEQKARLWLVPVMLGLGVVWVGVVVGVVASWETKAKAKLAREDARLAVMRQEPLPPRSPRQGGANVPEIIRKFNLLEGERELLGTAMTYRWYQDTDKGDRDRWVAEFRERGKAYTEVADQLEQEDWPSGNPGLVNTAHKILTAAAYYEGLTGNTDRALKRLLAVHDKLVCVAESRTSEDTATAWDGIESARACWLTIIQHQASTQNAAQLRAGALALLDRNAAYWTPREQLAAMDGRINSRGVGWPLQPMATLEAAVTAGGLADFLQNGTDVPFTRPNAWWQAQWAVQTAWTGYGLGIDRDFVGRARRFTAARMAAFLHRAETGAFPSSLATLSRDPLAKIAVAPAEGKGMPTELVYDGQNWFVFQPLPTDKPMLTANGAATMPAYTPRDWRRHRLVEKAPPTLSVQPGVTNQSVKPN